MKIGDLSISSPILSFEAHPRIHVMSNLLIELIN